MPSRSQYALSGIRAGTETCPYDHTNLRFFNWYAKSKFTPNRHIIEKSEIFPP